MSRVLVTGASGFLGSHFCERLLENGHEVVGMDNGVTGRTDNLADIFYDDRFTFYDHDVTEFVHVSGELDWVVHLASLASPVFYDEHPIKTLKVGALGTHKTLGLAKEKDANYLFASTSEVYGDPEVNPQSEEYRGNVDPFGPRSCYDESKRYGESLVRAYREEHGLDVRVARIFNTYGERMRIDDGRVIPTFARQALTGEDLTVYGDGEQTRSFCYVTDLVRGLRALAGTEDASGDVVNIGSTNELTINTLAEIVRGITDGDVDIVYEQLPEDDPQQRRPDISRARQLLDWEPTVTLEKGLKRTVDYFSAQRPE